MLKKNKIIGGIYSDLSDEVTKVCATCKWATPFNTVDFVMCSKKGLVKAEHKCKYYDYNRLLKTRKKRRNLTSAFSAEDFSID